MNISIQRFNKSNAAQLSAISKKTFYDTFTGTCTEEDMQWFLEKYFNEEGFFKELDNDNFFCYAAIINNEVAGFIKFKESSTDFTISTNLKSIELKSLYVDVPYHGKGVAQVLMNCLLQHVSDFNYQLIYLSVWEYNFKAQAFYKKFGFEPSGFTNDFPIGNTPQTDFWYWKKILN
ncbi:MAG: GNAT family N-acetyltransferase [Chitinophagaceae bacterium]